MDKEREIQYATCGGYGTWRVTTEGDCEGRSIRELGTYTGYIDEIGLYLADKQYYALQFRLIDPQPSKFTPSRTSVNISLDIDSGTWDMSAKQRKEYFKKMLGVRSNDIQIEDGKSYASVTINAGNGPEAREKIRKEMLRQEALNKLSKEEREILGV